MEETKAKILKVLNAIPNRVLYSKTDWHRILGDDKREIRVVEEVIDKAPGCFLRFDYWHGERIEHDFGKDESAIVDLYDEHAFGENAILRLLERDGWSGRWLNTCGSGKNAKFLTPWYPNRPNKDQTHVPSEEQEPRKLLDKVFRENGGSWGGCWDVFAWKVGRYLFAEAKAQRRGKALSPRYGDRPSENQDRWLRVALDLNDHRLECSSFVFVQWDDR